MQPARAPSIDAAIRRHSTDYRKGAHTLNNTHMYDRLRSKYKALQTVGLGNVQNLLPGYTRGLRSHHSATAYQSMATYRCLVRCPSLLVDSSQEFIGIFV